jgi:hypothetical protein
MPARRTGLEGVEKGLPAPSRSQAEMGTLRPRPVVWLAELATVPAARHPSLAYVGSVILAQFIPLLLEHVFV